MWPFKNTKNKKKQKKKIFYELENWRNFSKILDSREIRQATQIINDGLG